MGGVLKICLKKQSPFILKFFKSNYLERRFGAKSEFFKLTIGMWVLKTFVLKKNHFVLKFFKSDYLERRYGTKTAFFKITLGCGTQNVSL